MGTRLSFRERIKAWERDYLSGRGLRPGNERINLRPGNETIFQGEA